VSETAPPSPFLVTHLDRVVTCARTAPVADLACGRGRHAVAVAERGARVVALDRSPGALADLRERALARSLPIDPVHSDLESSAGIPLRPGACAAILVFRFLFRPLATEICEALRPGGLLVYETFTIHQREFGYGPRNPAFLLEPGELRALFPDLEVLDYFEGVADIPRPAALARLLARRRA
jgi:SAM-dependent methyltransferase